MNSASVLWAIGRQTELNAYHAVSSFNRPPNPSGDKTFLLFFYNSLLCETHTRTLLIKSLTYSIVYVQRHRLDNLNTINLSVN
jgi:hypothetical protein